MPVKANWKYRPQILTYPWGKANDRPLFTPKSIVWIYPEPECSNLCLRFWCSSYTKHLQDTGKPVFAIKFLSTRTKGCLQKLQEKRIKAFWLVFPSAFSSPYLCISNHQGATCLFSITWVASYVSYNESLNPPAGIPRLNLVHPKSSLVFSLLTLYTLATVTISEIQGLLHMLHTAYDTSATMPILITGYSSFRLQLKSHIN